MTVLYLSSKTESTNETARIPLEIIQDIFLASTTGLKVEDGRDSTKKSS